MSTSSVEAPTAGIRLSLSKATKTALSFSASCLRNLLPSFAPISLQWFSLYKSFSNICKATTVTHTKRIDRNLLRKETSFVYYTSSVLRKRRHMKQKKKLRTVAKIKTQGYKNWRLTKFSTNVTPPLNTATTLCNEPRQVSLSQKLNEIIKASRCCIANASNFTSSTFEVDEICLAQVLVFDDDMSLGNGKRSETHSRLRNSPVVRGFCCGSSLHTLNVHWSTLFQTRATAKHIHIVLKTHGKLFEIPKHKHESSHSWSNKQRDNTAMKNKKTCIYCNCNHYMFQH